jgi:hypothetical protein
MSDRTLEQRANIKICVNICKSASETVLLTFAHGEYAVKSWSVLEWHRQLNEGQEDVQDDPRSGLQKTQGTDAYMDRIRTLARLDGILGVRLTAEEGYGNICSEEKARTLT